MYAVPDQFSVSSPNDSLQDIGQGMYATIQAGLFSYITFSAAIKQPFFNFSVANSQELLAVSQMLGVGGALYGWSKYSVAYCKLNVLPTYTS